MLRPFRGNLVGGGRPVARLVLFGFLVHFGLPPHTLLIDRGRQIPPPGIILLRPFPPSLIEVLADLNEFLPEPPPKVQPLHALGLPAGIQPEDENFPWIMQI